MDELDLKANFQPASPGSVDLEDQALHVWAVPLVGDPEAWSALLSPAERERAGRFRVVDHRRRYAIAHGALRAILGGYAGQDPAGLEFRTGPRGKPYLERTPRLFFNLSHSAQLALVAVAHTELGADLEKMRHLESMLDIARRHFTAVEFAALEALPAEQRLCGFYRCWTRKEAYLKALGDGLGGSLDGFDVSIDEQPRFLGFRERSDTPTEWTLLDTSPADEYAAAVALRGNGHRLATFRFVG